MNQKEFGELIKLKRKEKNLTQNELSEKLGLSSYKTISKWENGIYMPDISLLTSISEILDVSLYELLGGKENMKKENVEEVLKNTIDKASEKNKVLFILKILIIILTITLITISILFGYKLYKENDYLFITNPVDVNIDNIDYNHVGILWYDDDIIKFSDFFTYYRFGEKNIGIEEAILKKLPLYKTKKGYSFISPNNRSIIYTLGNEHFDQSEDDINKMYKDKYYTKKAMFVNSVVLFNKIDNLESVIFKYSNANYEITPDHLKTYYNYITETHMCDNNQCNYLYHITIRDFEKDVINRLKNKEFLDNFFKEVKS